MGISLKELAPMLLAGAAGAASPRGADVFQNVLRMKQVSKESDRRDKRMKAQDERFARAEERAVRAEERSVESGKQIASLRDINIKEAEGKIAEREADQKALGKLRDEYFKSNPEVMEDPKKYIALNMADTYKQFNEMLDEFGELTTEQQASLSKDLKSQGISAQVGKRGVQSMRVDSPQQEEGMSKDDIQIEIDDITNQGSTKLAGIQRKIKRAQMQADKHNMTLRNLTGQGASQEELEEAREDAIESRDELDELQVAEQEVFGSMRVDISKVTGDRKYARDFVDSMRVQPEAAVQEEEAIEPVVSHGEPEIAPERALYDRINATRR